MNSTSKKVKRQLSCGRCGGQEISPAAIELRSGNQMARLAGGRLSQSRTYHHDGTSLTWGLVCRRCGWTELHSIEKHGDGISHYVDELMARPCSVPTAEVSR